MIGLLIDLAVPISEHMAAQRRIAEMEADIQRYRREYEELCREHAAADLSIIDVEARVVDIAALPAPEVEP